MSKSKNNKKELTKSDYEGFIKDLKARFEKNMNRHKGIKWADVETKLVNGPKIWSLNEMEISGGEPDVVGYDKKNGRIYFLRLFSRKSKWS